MESLRTVVAHRIEPESRQRIIEILRIELRAARTLADRVNLGEGRPNPWADACRDLRRVIALVKTL